MNGKLKITGVVLTVCAAALPVSVIAEQPWLEVAPGIHKVPDEVLSTMHGKYVSATNQVVYFGVQMSSNWSAPNGAVLSAGSNFAIDVSSPKPRFNYTSSVAVSPADNDVKLADTENRSISDVGVNNTSGMTQSIQTAGDGNDLENVVRVSMLDDIPDVSMTGSDEGSNGSTMNYTDGTQQLSASASLHDGEMGVTVGIKGQGEASQSVRGAVNALGGKGLFQKINVLGDNHVVVNRMGLDVVMGKATDAYITQQNIGNAINSLRGVSGNM